MFALRRTAFAKSLTAHRTFASTSVASKTVVDAVKDAAESVNKAASDAALKGIEVGETVAETVKDNVAPLADKAKNIAGNAQQEASAETNDASKVLGDAKDDFVGEAKKAAVNVQTEFNKAAR